MKKGGIFSRLFKNLEHRRDRCWYCGGQLCWNSDWDYADIHGEGEGIVTMLTCMDCGAEVEYTLKAEDTTSNIE